MDPNFKYLTRYTFAVAAWLLAVPILNGCTVNSLGAGKSPVTVAVLINHRWTEEDPRGFVWDVLSEEKSKEELFATCVREATELRNMSVKVITGTQFRAAVFPNLDPRSAPRSLEVLRLLIPNQRFQQRIKDAHIDYIAVLGGETHTSETRGDIGCYGGYGGGACFGLLWWDHETHLSALVVDMRSGVTQLQEGSEASSTSWFAMLAFIPVAMPATNEATGCKNFGRAVAQSLNAMNTKGE